MDQYAVRRRTANGEAEPLRAVRVDLGNLSEVAAWCDGDALTRRDGERGVLDAAIVVGEQSARPGSWIVRSTDGQGLPAFYVYDHDVFMLTFAPA